MSTREDRFEWQVCTSVESYYLFNNENDLSPQGKISADDASPLKPARVRLTPELTWREELGAASDQLNDIRAISARVE